MTRRIRYSVAASLDGFIAAPGGAYDWIPMDPDIDFGALAAQFDTVLAGRKTYEVMASSGQASMPGMEVIVVSRTTPGAVSDLSEIARLKTRPGKDIWLFGGGSLFRSLAEARLVDTVEVAVVPVLLGGGIPLFPPPADRVPLKLVSQRVYQKSGIVSLEYSVATKEK